MSTARLLPIHCFGKGSKKNVPSNHENPIQKTSKSTTETHTCMYCFGGCEDTWSSHAMCLAGLSSGCSTPMKKLRQSDTRNIPP